MENWCLMISGIFAVLSATIWRVTWVLLSPWPPGGGGCELLLFYAWPHFSICHGWGIFKLLEILRENLAFTNISNCIEPGLRITTENQMRCHVPPRDVAWLCWIIAPPMIDVDNLHPPLLWLGRVSIGTGSLRAKWWDSQISQLMRAKTDLNGFLVSSSSRVSDVG